MRCDSSPNACGTMRAAAVVGTVLFTALWAAATATAVELESSAAAQRVDQLLLDELSIAEDNGDADEAVGGLPLVEDDAFLRRVSLDLVGEPPTPDELTAFVLDPSADKRMRVVDRLLADPRFGQNWGRYWRDVILYRHTDKRALLASRSGEEFLAEQFNQNRPWDEIARELVTAEGSIGAEGDTVLMVAQWGEIPDTAAEVSRVLLGIQIQCAQCHDHPVDDWTREQFHELAAFFPRIRIQREVDEKGKRRGFSLVSFDRTRPSKKSGKPGGEYYMPDLNEPSAQGTLMKPVFFATGQELGLGMNDLERRSQLAEWIVSPDNRWFATAFVNRIWTELVGTGFYAAVDDLGDDRPCTAPQTLELLRQQFVEHGHDVKWLFRTIAATEIYQRADDFEPAEAAAPLAATCTQRLRSDELYGSLMAALEMRLPDLPRDRPSYRTKFAESFGFDPSTPSDEISSSIPQALALMNSEDFDRAISAARRGGVLRTLLEQTTDNEELIVEIYLRALAREPKDTELKTCLDYIAEVGNQAEALEDILWSLINSTEFLYRN